MGMVKIYQLNLDLQPIKEFVYNMQKSTQLNVMKSNIGGWQSQIEKEWPKVLFGLRDFIQSKIPKQTFMTLWYNINGRGCYNLMHDHNTEEGCSGVFYIDVPDKNMGNLYFENGKEYEPIPNRLILFPADLKHGVKPNQSNQPRFSMSFNYVMYPEKEIKFQGQQYLESGITI